MVSQFVGKKVEEGSMVKFWDGLVGWWQGKKTILGGSLVMAAAVGGVWYGKLSAVDGLTLLGIGLSIAGFSAKANRHQAELLTALEGVSQAGTEIRAGQPGESVLKSVAQQAARADWKKSAASLHLSTDTASELAIAIQHLAGNSDGPPLGPIEVPARGEAR
jgi:hypothetical protein